MGLLVTGLRGDMGGSLPVKLTMLVSWVDFFVPLRGDLEVLDLLAEGPGDTGSVSSVRVDEENCLAEFCRLGFGDWGVSL